MTPTRVLIVDDESGFTHLLRLTLEGTRRFLVEEVNDGRQTLTVARTFRPDIIFLDIVMPDIDGGDVAKQLRADPELADVPIVFLTAIVSPHEAASETRFGGFPFLAKPVSVATLIATIEAHCPG